MRRVDVIIPSYKPDEKLRKLLERLLVQRYPVENIIIINTDQSLLDPALIPEDPRISVTHIEKSAFDHGATRNLGVSKSTAELFLLMTEDAVPKDEHLVERLVQVFETDPYKDAAPCVIPPDLRDTVTQTKKQELQADPRDVISGQQPDRVTFRADGQAATAEHQRPMEQTCADGQEDRTEPSYHGEQMQADGKLDGGIGLMRGPIGAVYGRQLATEESSYDEQYARQFNYPVQSFVKTQQDLPRLGIKTYFESNVCCMYRRDIFDRLGGFIDHTIFNEDMIYCGKLLQAGYASAYEASAEVYHAHHYSGVQQFHRNFDLGVSQADHPEIFGGLRSEGEGVKLVLGNARALLRQGRIFTIPNLIWKSGCKYLGFRMGRNYRKLSRGMILRCTMNPRYWDQESQQKM